MDSLTLLLIAASALAGAAILAAAAYVWPRGMLSLAFFVVLLAGTKFRRREASEALSGSVDSQVLYELGLYALLGLILVTVFVRLRPGIRRPTWFEGILLAFGVLAVASTAWSTVPHITLVRSFQFLVLLGLAAMAVRVLEWSGIRDALTGWLILYLLVFAALAVAMPAARSDWMAMGAASRFAWFAVHPITIGTLAGAALVLLFVDALFPPRREWMRIVGVPLLVTAPLLAAILIATRSRGPIFATLVACVFLVFRRTMRPWLASMATIASLLLAGALVVVNASDLFAGWLQQSRISENPALEFLVRGNSLEYLMTLGGRTKLWAEVGELYLTRPWLGWGYTATRSVLLERVPWASYAHNALAQTLLDLGLAGTVLLWFVFLRALFADLLEPRWAGIPGGRPRAFVFGALLFVFAQSVLSETFAGAPGYELLLVLSCALVSERIRVGRAGILTAYE